MVRSVHHPAEIFRLDWKRNSFTRYLTVRPSHLTRLITLPSFRHTRSKMDMVHSRRTIVTPQNGNSKHLTQLTRPALTIVRTPTSQTKSYSTLAIVRGPFSLDTVDFLLSSQSRRKHVALERAIAPMITSLGRDSQGT
jgi:hypothetical protein